MHILIGFDMTYLWVFGVILAAYLAWKIIIGFIRFKRTMKSINAEGLLRFQHRVFVRMKFPLIRRLTFAHVYLSKRRFVLFHFLTRGLILQAPLGPMGKAGKEEGRFDVEKRTGRSLLVFRTTMRGGGRIRFHVNDAEGWLKDILQH